MTIQFAEMLFLAAREEVVMTRKREGHNPRAVQRDDRAYRHHYNFCAVQPPNNQRLNQQNGGAKNEEGCASQSQSRQLRLQIDVRIHYPHFLSSRYKALCRTKRSDKNFWSPNLFSHLTNHCFHMIEITFQRTPPCIRKAVLSLR